VSWIKGKKIGLKGINDFNVLDKVLFSRILTPLIKPGSWSKIAVNKTCPNPWIKTELFHVALSRKLLVRNSKTIRVRLDVFMLAKVRIKAVINSGIKFLRITKQIVIEPILSGVEDFLK
jgi:hypothetical protein